MPAEIKGLVGESGSGKTTLARAILGTLPKNSAKISSGIINYGKLDLLKFLKNNWLIRFVEKL